MILGLSLVSVWSEFRDPKPNRKFQVPSRYRFLELRPNISFFSSNFDSSLKILRYSASVPRPKTKLKIPSYKSLPIPRTETEPSLKKHYSQTLTVNVIFCSFLTSCESREIAGLICDTSTKHFGKTNNFYFIFCNVLLCFILFCFAQKKFGK